MTADTTLVFRGTPQAESARRAHEASLSPPAAPRVLEASWLRDLCLEVGASDAGFVELSRPGLGAEAEHARRLFPRTKTLVCLVGISNRDALRSVSRAAANVAWHYTGDRLDHAAAALCERLAESGVGGVPTTIGFLRASQ